jgi:serine protease Do
MNRVIPSLCWIAFGVSGTYVSLAQNVPSTRPANNRSLILHRVDASYLGIGVAEIDSERATTLNLKEVRGVEVKSVDPNSPAAKAGLKEGDVVLEYNGHRIEGTEQFVRLVHETPVDRQVHLVVWRNGDAQTLTATIGHRPEHFSLRRDDGDQEWTLDVPPLPPIPSTLMPEMPPMPEFPNAITVLRGGMLGIECENLGSQLAEFFGVKEGVLVRSVTRNSAAEKAGIRAGDVIVKIDGEAVTSAREITSLLRTARSKRTFPVLLVREKKEMTVNVTIESGGRSTRPVVFHSRWA